MSPIDPASAPLKVALLSYAYAPSLGGIESVSQLVADGLRSRGYEVRVVTSTPAVEGEPDPDGILRRPSSAKLLETLRWCDVVVQSNVSVWLAWPLVFNVVQRPWVVVNHTPISRPTGQRTLRDRLKIASLRGADVYSVSNYLRSVTVPTSGLMLNPYDVRSFHLGRPEDAAVVREDKLLFVGRITRAKGLDVLIEALSLLRRQGYTPRLSIAGEGLDKGAIEARIAELGMQSQIAWLGVLRGHELGRAMRQHRIAVVPSRPEPPEALPLVPIELIASGCVVIASRQGGLPESVGPCGILVPPEDPVALADAIRELLDDEQRRAQLLAQRDQHLKLFHPNTVLDRYEDAIRRAMHPSDAQ